MTHTLYIIHPHGKVEIEHSPNKQVPLEWLQRAIGGGYIELVPGFTTYEAYEGKRLRCRAYCDEDGIGKRLDANQIATRLWAGQVHKRGGMIPHSLLGRIVVVVKDRAK